MSGYYSADADIPLNIALVSVDSGMGVTILARRMVFDKDGALKDNRYMLSQNIDYDEETIRLLKDTLSGMEAELNHLLRKNRNKENA